MALGRLDPAIPAHRVGEQGLRGGGRLALRAATWILGALPFFLGYRRPIDRLDPAQRDAALRRAAELPVARDLIEVLKLIACFAYFDDDAVQAAARAGP